MRNNIATAAVLAQQGAAAQNDKILSTIAAIRDGNAASKAALTALTAAEIIPAKTAAFATGFAGVITAFQVFNRMVGVARDLMNAYSL